MTDFIKFELSNGKNLIVQRSQISSVNDIDINLPDEIDEDTFTGNLSEIIMVNGSKYVVRYSAEYHMMHTIGTKSNF